MWGMEDLSSDHDLFCCYATPSSEYLRTGNFHPTRAAKTHQIIDWQEYDFQYMEIGHLVNLLVKGNINAIWAVCSPIVHEDNSYLHNLIEIVKNNLSRASYASINGMAHSQLNDVIKRAAVKDPLKSKATACRTLVFGSNMLEGNGLKFEPATGEFTPKRIGEEFRRLEEAKENSSLLEEVNDKEFRDFLFGLRMDEIVKGVI